MLYSVYVINQKIILINFVYLYTGFLSMSLNLKKEGSSCDKYTYIYKYRVVF